MMKDICKFPTISPSAFYSAFSPHVKFLRLWCVFYPPARFVLLLRHNFVLHFAFDSGTINVATTCISVHSPVSTHPTSSTVSANVICLQLNDQLATRCGVAVVGPPGCGKTLITRLLADSVTKAGSPVRVCQIFPNVIPKSKLLGTVDVRTR